MKSLAEIKLELYIQERVDLARAECMLEVVRKMLSVGLSFDDIIKISGWSREQILRVAADTKL